MRWSHFVYQGAQPAPDGPVDIQFNLWGTANKTIPLSRAERPADWDGTIKPGDVTHHNSHHSVFVLCRIWLEEPIWKLMIDILDTLQRALDQLDQAVQEPHSNRILIGWGTSLPAVMVAECMQLDIRPKLDPRCLLDSQWGEEDLRIFPGRASDEHGRHLLPFVSWPDSLERPWEH